MYLLPAGSPARTRNKWGMGAWKLPPKYRRTLRGLRGLGDDGTDQLIAPGVTPIPQLAPIVPSSIDLTTTDSPITGTLVAPTVSPIVMQPGVNPAVQAAYQNLLTQQQNSTDPLDYVSPQAAIAAGLPAQQVYNSWSSSIAKFPTQQAALAAGVPAGVVTQLWAQSRSAVPAPSASWLDQSSFGVSNKMLLLGGGAILLVTMAGGGKRGR